MNHVLTLTRNCLQLTKRCVASILAQDIPVVLTVIDNGSTDGSAEWLRSQPLCAVLNGHNYGVSFGWNQGLKACFGDPRTKSVMVCGNDTRLGSWTYRQLLSYEVPFVTGVAVDNDEQVLEHENGGLTDNPDFSLYLMSRQVWETVGPFDQNMKFYAQDQDYHIRSHRIGIRLCKSPTEYYHERSSTLRLALPSEQQEIHAQANRDREALRKKWGVSAGGADYEALFNQGTFGIDRQ